MQKLLKISCRMGQKHPMSLFLVTNRSVQDEEESWKKKLCIGEGETSQRKLEIQNMEQPRKMRNEKNKSGIWKWFRES